ncbi:hypothetical protein K469DRAFT_129010 [Zopfia rhizophila CBS 207.26]|uniref:Uncharacterized protein n=1 Tax=Zopfia rhizophila CBS 207.26 TaxID=1314779 RepID=A0A6A6EWM2_9PEZI|nr:hypothetical protein K469DRAFT_129010 [Zopfia rhizophila CBS 207.26]
MMENEFQEPYRDSPTPSRTPSPAAAAKMSSTKPLPSIPTDNSAPQEESYRDEPSPLGESPMAAPRPQRHRTSSDQNRPVHYPPYTDDDDVPLAHLYPCPTEAPPAYNVAVRQSYRETLISHIPSGFGVTIDEEAGVEQPRADDVRFSVERVVAKIIVAALLVLVTVILIWQALAIKKLL